MFSRVRNFFYRHRRKFIVTGVIIGGTVLLSRYVQRALRDWQERETKELLERTRKQQHYESVERTCDQTALVLAPSLKDTITKLVKTDLLISQLKNGSTDKIRTWEELKILAFTKVSLLVYASSMLMVTLRIQLNLIGGYMYRDTVEETEQAQVGSNLQEKYLCVCQYFINEGTQKLCELLGEKVRIIIEEKSLKDKLTLHDIEQIFWAIQTSVSRDIRDPCKGMISYILPDDLIQTIPEQQQPVMNKIIMETKDLLESDEIIALTTSCISRGFSYTMDQVAEYFNPHAPVPSTSTTPDTQTQKNFLGVNSVSIPFAKVIPIVNGLVQGHGVKTDMPHKWMQQLILMDVLKVMGANVYETFSNKE